MGGREEVGNRDAKESENITAIRRNSRAMEIGNIQSVPIMYDEL